MQIRSATFDDLASLAQLFDGYRVYYQQNSDMLIATRFIAERLTQRDSTIFVAQEDEGPLLGFVQLYPIFSSVKAQKSLLLNDLFVTPSARRAGVARALMQKAKRYAKKQLACWIMLQTEHSNHNAQALYESLGYKKDQDCFYYYLS
ncbi:GNAT family N-acetyltransferase [Aliiglaciecola sp. LCG003]|uniref:GNAT family N-acetyltransferase n=1 Tax=Aliiglaciecola sp. LCG003 TaxID=3053655 RepID=UPI00257384C2|nr:GNAT family N-acetyltransferase [Aliiglaciecola sp. LCG003]WJG09365.1 GNAT family N-acetyltransferase [Aliiglaciecola sp. LCG003]